MKGKLKMSVSVLENTSIAPRTSISLSDLKACLLSNDLVVGFLLDISDVL